MRCKWQDTSKSSQAHLLLSSPSFHLQLLLHCIINHLCLRQWNSHWASLEHAGFKRNCAELPLVCTFQSFIAWGVCEGTQTICQGKTFMGENTTELISTRIFTYRSFFIKQNTIDQEDIENYWVKMLPKTRCLRNTAQNEGAKAAVLSQKHLGNSSAIYGNGPHWAC